MNELDPLADVLGSGRAAAIRQALATRNQTITADNPPWTAGGYSGAVLVEVEVAYDQADHPRPVRCIAKVCPPAQRRPESAQHDAARRQSRPEFVDRHLVRVPFDPVEGLDGEIVSFQMIAGGRLRSLRTLSQLHGDQLVDACRVVRAALLEEWTGVDYRTTRLALPQLLRQELRGGFPDWSMVPAGSWIETADQQVLHDLVLARRATSAADAPKAHLTGRSHGDLHAKNVLVPTTASGTALPDEFWLIDLASFERDAPLSRDPATLLVSILAHRVGDLTLQQRRALLEHLSFPAPQWPAPTAAPADLVAIADVLRDPGGAPFTDAGWREVWEEQMQVSVLAEALRHTTYDSVGSDGQVWCWQLAALLATTLTSAPSGAESPPSRAAGVAIQTADHAVRLGTVPKRPIINQNEVKARLRAAILDAGPAVIVAHGMAGIGKSALVGEIVAELRETRTRVCEHDATGVERPDAMTLINDIEGGAASDDRCRPGESLPARLAAAVDALDERVTIIVDRADLLLTSETRTMADEDFDDALESLSSAQLVRVVLISRDVPRSTRSNTWPDNARLIHVPGLDESHFGQYLARLDPAGETGLTTLTGGARQLLRDRLQGNPTYAGLAYAIVASLDGEYGAETLVTALRTMRPRKVPQFLADAQLRRLPGEAKLVLAAVAAFGIPVKAASVCSIVRDRLTPSHVTETLRKLATRRLVEVTDSLYRIPSADLHNLLDGPPVADQDWQNLLFDAARELGFSHKRRADVHDIDDLETYFAELDVWLRAKRYGAAYEQLEVLDWLLRRWDRPMLLLERRERLRTLLDTPLDRMSNYNALGDLYATRGRFADAAGAFRAALDIAIDAGDVVNRLRIETNIAATHWEAGETVQAAERYRNGLKATELHGDATDRLSALEGLADCHRRWGDYTSAMPMAQQALSIAQQVGSDRAVNIALKLARWYGETGDLSGAERLVAAAETDAAEHEDEALRTVCADGRADLLLLTDGREAEALEVAGAVLAAARRQRSPVILLQVQTTRCMAYLRLGDLDKADEAIEAACRYRRGAGRSLVVLALRALVTALDGHTADADRRFEQLHCEATDRHRSDPRDVGALQFLGYARCWPGLTHDVELHEAAEHFRKARKQTRPVAPGLAERLAYLVRRLEDCSRRAGRLQPVLGEITG